MNQLYVVMYHYTRDLKNSRYPNIKGLDNDLFKKQIQFLAANFNIITMEQVLEALNTENEILPRNAMLLTFDDGYIDNLTVALPILKEHKLQGSFFIPGKSFQENTLLDVNKIHYLIAVSNEKRLVSELLKKLDFYRGKEHSYPSTEELISQYAIPNRFDTKEIIFVKRILQKGIPDMIRKKILNELFEEFLGTTESRFSRELYLNRDQIRFMKNEGMFIGLHGYEHDWLGDLTLEAMQFDVDKALEVMDEFIDKESWVLNYPYGSYSQEVIQYISNHGCQAAMTTEARVAKITTENRYIIPRLDTNDFLPISNNYKKL